MLRLPISTIDEAVLTVKVSEFDVVAPGVTTLTVALPLLAIALAGTDAVSCVELPKLLVSAVPFHNTVSPETKLAPLTVSVNVVPPAGALDGDSALREGTGGLIAKLRELDVPPAAVCTVTATVPMVAIKPAGTAAESCVELPKVVARALPFQLGQKPRTATSATVTHRTCP